MANTFTSDLVGAREASDSNFVKRGHSSDSQETQDSPFGSSLATPVDMNDVGVISVSSLDSLASRFLVAAGDVPFVDYFRFKQRGLPILSRTLGLSSRSSAEDIPSIPGYAAEVSSASNTPADDTLWRKSSTYNLHNKPINMQGHINQEASVGSCISGTKSIKESDGNHGMQATAEELLLTTEGCAFDDYFALTIADEDYEDPLWFVRSANLSSLIKTICFVPWCICVGGTMLLCPDNLELVAFQAGYVDPMRGIRRFAHWADLGQQFVMIFLAFFVCVLWFLPPAAGVTLVAGLISRFMFVWQGFQINYSLPLGEDDRHSLYLLATIGERGLMDRSVMAKTETGYIVTSS